MKRNLIIASCLIFAGITTYFSIWWMDKHKYDPIVYDDGSVEYRLISPDSTQKKPKTDALDQHWVLRFPKELRVFRPEVEQTLFIYRQKHPIPLFRPNYALRFYFTFPDFAMQNKILSYSNKDMLLVTLFAPEQTYEPNEQSRKYNTSFIRLKDPKFNPKCTKDKEIISGLFLLKSRTEKERKRVRKEYGPNSGNCGLISNEISESLYYSVHNTFGQIQGAGYCDQGITQRCYFEFWLPQRRVVKYIFYSRHLSRIHETHAAVVDLLTKATDKNKSLNMIHKKGFE